MKTIHANLVIDQSILEGEITFNHKINSIKIINQKENPNLSYVLPGFIDLHIHGGGGVDVMDDAKIDPILETHLKNGTTSLLLTTVTAPHHDLVKTFKKISKKKENNQKNEAKILGIHLEGPYINKEKLGAQPDFVRLPNLNELKELQALSQIKTITIAPEVLDKNLMTYLNEEKIKIQLGHSNCLYEEAEAAFKNGVSSVTHLYNAMSALHHRSPGLVGASLAHAKFAEIIPDLLHVHPGAIKVALRSIPKLYFVTDATSSTGMPDGEYQLGKNTVYKCPNGVRLKDGTLAGSSITMINAFKNLISDKINLSIPEASYRLSGIPSELIGMDHERGFLKMDQFADLLVLDRNFSILEIYREGEKV